MKSKKLQTAKSQQKERSAMPRLASSLETENAHLLEVIRQKSDQNTIILSLSHAIASVRHKIDLFDVIDQKLKKLFDFDDFVICLINDDQQTHSPFIYNQKEDFLKTEGVPPTASKKYTLNDGMCKAMIASATPTIFNVDEVLAWKDAPMWLSFWKNKGIKEMVGLKMTDASGCIGFFYIYTKHENLVSNVYFDLLHGIALQISIAISNIRANEKIERQLEEINKYKQKLEDEASYLKDEIRQKYNHSEIIGESEAVKKVFFLIDQVATSDSTVLILGETGTGKELIARAIHNASPRGKQLMVKINCAALPPGLAESELFGHEKGSFTGAIERRIGKFELAHDGTLFLDEIGELSLALQVKLLRALQEKEIERIGGKTTIKTNVRIIAATNRDLLKEVERGNFRSDLYYRLNVFPITVPALRDRLNDIPALVSHFMDSLSKKTGKHIHSVAKSTLNKLMTYSWPGNIRELEHLIERSILLNHGSILKEVHLPPTSKTEISSDGTERKIKTIHENERDHILSILKRCKGKISGNGGAAEILNIPATTLNSKIKKLNIQRAHIIND